MALTDDERDRLILETHSFTSEIQSRGCKVGIDRINKVAGDLEKNTREHIWLKGWSYAVGVFVTMLTWIISLIWKKTGG
jgi:hypothetical protein|tara:strand:- start:485 stop:721 length:237 start_codon:yes stop_codon:yes gene_type:complete